MAKRAKTKAKSTKEEFILAEIIAVLLVVCERQCMRKNMIDERQSLEIR